MNATRCEGDDVYKYEGGFWEANKYLPAAMRPDAEIMKVCSGL